MQWLLCLWRSISKINVALAVFDHGIDEIHKQLLKLHHSAV